MTDFKTVFSVSQFTRHLSDTLRREFMAVRIQGEVASFTKASSGHWYFSLKDDQAQVKAVMFRQRNVLVGFLPKLGDKLEALAQVGLYEPRGELQILVDTLKHAGQGDLHERYLRLKAMLAAEGLFSQERKRPLPKYVFDVAIVTSMQAAALADIRRTLARRAPHVSYTVYHTAVQGDAATAQIVSALRQADSAGHELILLARGGGSLEDLWCFNEESVVRALAACATPTVVGVGHESDVTLAEFAADVRASTPTAAAELVSAPTADLLARVQSMHRDLLRIVDRTLQQKAQQLDRLEMGLVTPTAYLAGLEQRMVHARNLMQRHLQQLVRASDQSVAGLAKQANRALGLGVNDATLRHSQLGKQLGLAMKRQLQDSSLSLQAHEGTMKALSPQRNLEKGYAFLQTDSGLVNSIDRVEPGQHISATVADGQLKVLVTDKSKGSGVPPL